MKFITELNDQFRGDVNKGITSLFSYINNKGNTFVLARRYQLSGISENKLRKLLDILVISGNLTRVRIKGESSQNDNTGISFRKRPYLYKVTDRFSKVLSHYIRKVLGIYNYIEATNDMTITSFKRMILNMFNKTTFIRNKFGTLIYNIRGERHAILTSKQGLIIKYGGTHYDVCNYYNLIIKKK